jgi:spore germination protein KC
MPMRNRMIRFLILLFISVCVLLAGCWDRRELEERTSVLALAIDRAKEKEELYRVTVQIPIPIKIAGSGGQGGGSSEDAVKVMSVTGRSVADAINNIQQRLNQQIFLGHTRVLAISEEVARKGMGGVIDSFRRDPQIRRLLWPIVVKGEAARLLEIKPGLTQIPVVYLMDLIESGSKMGMIPDQTLGDYFNQTSNSALQPYLNYVEASENEVKWKGLAVFREQKMMGVLDPVHSWVLLQLRDKDSGGDIVIPLSDDKTGYLTFRPHFVSTKVKVEHKHGVPGGHEAIYVCEVQGDVVETTVRPKVKEKEFIREVQKLVKQEMEKRAAKLLHQLQKEFRSDILKLGLTLRAHHYWEYWKKHNWEEEFPTFKIKVVYNIKLRRLGMEMD